MLDLLRKIAAEHPLFRPEALAILGEVLGTEPQRTKDDANQRIKERVLRGLVDLMWGSHPSKGARAHDGVEMDVLELMTAIAKGAPDAKVRDGASRIAPAGILRVFASELFRAIEPPYSPAFSRALGDFLSAGSMPGLVVQMRGRDKATYTAVKTFVTGGYLEYVSDAAQFALLRAIERGIGGGAAGR